MPYKLPDHAHRSVVCFDSERFRSLLSTRTIITGKRVVYVIVINICSLKFSSLLVSILPPQRLVISGGGLNSRENSTVITLRPHPTLSSYPDVITVANRDTAAAAQAAVGPPKVAVSR